MGHFGVSSYQGESDKGNGAPDDPGDGPHRPRADAGADVAKKLNLQQDVMKCAKQIVRNIC